MGERESSLRMELEIVESINSTLYFQDDRSYGSLLRQAFETKSLPEQFLKSHSESVGRLKDNSNYINWIDELNLDRAIKNLSETLCLDEYQNTVLPTLKKPSPLFRWKIVDLPTYILLDELVADMRQRTKDIFSRSKLTDSGFRYSTMDGTAGPFIVGNNNNSFASLIGITHELGHCLIESEFPPKTFLDKILGEVYAHAFEYQVIRGYIDSTSPALLIHWDKYHRQIDALNLNIFFMELNALTIKHKERFSPYCFDLFSLLLRESFFMMPGFQAAYLLASIHSKGIRNVCNAHESFDQLKALKTCKFQF